MGDPAPPGLGVADLETVVGSGGSASSADEIPAAGAVLWRPGNQGPEVALIHRPHYDDWTFPKGKAEPGEHVLLTAVREVTEETGIPPVLGRRLPTIRYQSKGRPKRVDYWAATPASGPVREPAPAEVDRVEWVPVAAAKERLTYPHDAVLLSELTSGPAAAAAGPGTVPFILLRHATAEPKRGWAGDDLLRPLDPPGRAQAGAIAVLLACFGAARVISSATTRCVDTVLRYAVSSGVTVRAEPALTIGAPVDAGEGRLRDLLAERVPTVFCGHGETMPGQLTALCRELRADPPQDPVLQKGSFWVLHAWARATEGAPGLAAIERHAP